MRDMQLLTVSQVAEQLQLSAASVRGLIRSRDLIAIDVSRPGTRQARWRVLQRDLDRFVERRSASVPQRQRQPRTMGPVRRQVKRAIAERRRTAKS